MFCSVWFKHACYFANPHFYHVRVHFLNDAMAEGQAGSNVETLVQRHENRQVLLQRLNALRQQVRTLEQEVSDIECVVHGLPYAPAYRASAHGRDTALQHFHVAATAGAARKRKWVKHEMLN